MQHFADLQENSEFGDPDSWLSAQDHSTSSTTAANGNLDRDLFNDLVEIVPLVQSLIVTLFPLQFFWFFVVEEKKTSLWECKLKLLYWMLVSDL